MEKLVSNEEILEQARILVNTIKEDDTYKEYINLRKKISMEEEIMQRIERVKNLQKQYVRGAYLDKSLELSIQEELKKLESFPLYKEYLLKTKKVNNIFETMEEGLNILFDNILNNK